MKRLNRIIRRVAANLELDSTDTQAVKIYEEATGAEVITKEDIPDFIIDGDYAVYNDLEEAFAWDMYNVLTGYELFDIMLKSKLFTKEDLDEELIEQVIEQSGLLEDLAYYYFTETNAYSEFFQGPSGVVVVY